MTPPTGHKDDHFRFDGEFVALIKTQAEQKILLDNLQEKIADVKDFNAQNFNNINKNLENLTSSVQSIQTNCIAHQVLEDQKKQKQPQNDAGAFLIGLNPYILKVMALVVAMVIGYLLNIPIKP